VGVANFFLGQSIGIDETKRFQCILALKLLEPKFWADFGVRLGVAPC